MSLTENLAWSLEASMGMLKSALSDLSEADFLTRPVPASNHPNWQLGHLIASQHGMLSAAGAKCPALPSGFEAKYKKETSTSDDATAFLTKDQLIGAFDQLHQASIAFIKSATSEQLSAPSPEKVRGFAPTIVDLISVQPMHIAMHLGQIQVLRRKLGKPVLF